MPKVRIAGGTAGSILDRMASAYAARRKLRTLPAVRPFPLSTTAPISPTKSSTENSAALRTTRAAFALNTYFLRMLFTSLADDFPNCSRWVV